MQKVTFLITEFFHLSYMQIIIKKYLLLVTDQSVILANKFSFDEEFYNHEFKTTFNKTFLPEIDWNYFYKATSLKIAKITL